MNDDDKNEQGKRPEARPLSGDGLECFSLEVQLHLAVEKNPSTAAEDSLEQAPAENISLSGYWLENLNTPATERIKPRFTPGTMFFELQHKVDALEKSPPAARVQTTLGSDKPDTQ